MISYAKLQEIEESASCPECRHKVGLLLEAISDWPAYGLMEPTELLTCWRAEIGQVLTAETISAFRNRCLRQLPDEDSVWKAQACGVLTEFLRTEEEKLSSSKTLEDAIAALAEQCLHMEKRPD